MNVDKLHPDVLEALHGRGHTEESIRLMAPTTVFSEYCEWNGMIEWADTLLRVLKNAQECNM